MTDHKTGTREQWLTARLELLEAEKALTRRSDELARRRQELPWVRVEKDYRFTTEDGDASLRCVSSFSASSSSSRAARHSSRVPVLRSVIVSLPHAVRALASFLLLRAPPRRAV